MWFSDFIMRRAAEAPRLTRLLTRLAAVYASFRLVGSRSMQRFTPLGKLLLATYGLSLFFVMDTRSTMNFQMFALLLVLLVVSFCLSYWFAPHVRGIELQRIFPRSIQAGTSLEYVVLLRNTGDTPQKGLHVLDQLQMSREQTGRLPPPSSSPVQTPAVLGWSRLLHNHAAPFYCEAEAPVLPPKGEARICLRAQAPQRGVLHCRESALAMPDPLGIFRSFSPVAAGEKILVVPAHFPVPEFSLPGGRRHNPEGLRLASNIGENGEFASLREYRNGDPLRHIHWRSWARYGKPIVKEFQEEYFTRHGLVLDTFPNPNRVPGARDIRCFEAAVSAAASFAAAPLDQDALLDLLFVENVAHCVTTGRGLGSSEQMLEILAAVLPCLEGGAPSQGFARLAALVLSHAARMSGCICVLLGFDDQRRNMLNALAAQGIETLALVLPMPGEPMPETPAPGIRVLNPENLQQELAEL